METLSALLYHPRAIIDIWMHDVVALLEDLPATHFETGRPLTLCRGEMRTVVMTYDGSAVEVEFSADDGCAYAMLPIAPSKLRILPNPPDSVVA